ncbi:MAG TPA: hypothetical protein VKA13_05955 [Gammaproteobacteria bacterium]|nr:hypothetical protein [Gammaproteobacteria bacterium]
MIQLELTDDEQGILKTALESYISDLRMEIADTDNMDFRNKLKEKEQVLNKVVKGIAPNTAAG